MKRLLAAAAAVVLLLLGGRAILRRAPASPPLPRVAGSRLELLPRDAPPLFARALAPRPFALPRDHGPHFDYETEWWYYTGSLQGEDGGRFGYQLTIFRRGLTPGPPPAGPGLETNQVYFAHFALTDAARARHVSAERWSRGAADLAGAQGEPYRVFLDDWRVESENADGSSVRLDARDGGNALSLRLRSAKPLVAHGDRGLSPKSGEQGNASYYVGYTRMASSGELSLDGRKVAVDGESWFDHEWSTSALGPGAVGWDWFSLQLGDGRELMYFQIRRDDGSILGVSGGTLVAADGTARRVSASELKLEVLDHWTSPANGARYPSRWSLRAPAERLELTIEPLVADQEMRLAFTYWEGAVRVSGRGPSGPLAGWGYVELTGYAASMQGVF